MPAKGKRRFQFIPPCYKLIIMKKLTLFCGVFFISILSLAQNREQNEKKVQLDSVVIQAYRAGTKTPVAHSSLSKEQIVRESPMNSVPMMFSFMPSVVTSTEGGNGLGYSSIRVRGTDGSRINVTLNGIALNDAESQEVFWVNLPALSSFLEDVQLQRGVGTSTNGPAAFGASINMNTLKRGREAYGMAELSYGSFSSYTTTAGAGTGLSKRGLSFDVRYSRNSGKGFVRNGKSDLNSLYATVGWSGQRTSVRFNYMMGDQKTGITWLGLTREQMANDRRYNPAGEYKDEAGNRRYYDNETDNYQQHHFQLMFSRLLGARWSWSTTLHYTLGSGYYENYKYKKKYSSYGLPNQTVEGVTYSKSDFIIRQYLENDLLAANSFLTYSGKRMTFTTSMAYSYYDGDHYGNLLWAKNNGNIPKDWQWYFNNGKKHDFNIVARSEFDITDNLTAYADLQYRRVKYNLEGPDKDFALLDKSLQYNFFNPKLGFSYNLNRAGSLYLSAAIAHREPSRSDIKESIKALRTNDIKPERMTDFEMGYKFTSQSLDLSANIFFMEYKNQLIPTGRLTETGYVIKENVKKSYRRGVEISAGWRPFKIIDIRGNIAVSKNRILDYTNWTDRYDNPNDWNKLPQESIFMKETRAAYSPELTSAGIISIIPVKSVVISLNGKFVGKQYYDNTQNDYFSIPAYAVFGASISKVIEIKKRSNLNLSCYVNNIFNRKYYSNAWLYRAIFDDGSPDYIEEGLFPQPGTNFIVKATFNF